MNNRTVKEYIIRSYDYGECKEFSGFVEARNAANQDRVNINNNFKDVAASLGLRLTLSISLNMEDRFSLKFLYTGYGLPEIPFLYFLDEHKAIDKVFRPKDFQDWLIEKVTS